MRPDTMVSDDRNRDAREATRLLLPYPPCPLVAYSMEVPIS